MHNAGVKKLALFGVIVEAALLASCASLRRDEPLLVVTAQRDGDGCLILVDGERVTSDLLLEVAGKAKKRRAIVLYDKNTPYKCIGGSIFTLQRAGIAPVDAAMWAGS